MTIRTLIVLAAAASLCHADSKKLTEDQRIEIMRGLVAEYAKAVIPLPRSQKPLEVDPEGHFDHDKWEVALGHDGPAARANDLVQVTKVDIEKSSVVLEINHGFKGKSGGGSWRDRIQISGGMGGVMVPVNGRNATSAPGGTVIALRFDQPIGALTAAEVKKMLAPVLDFDKHSATEQYIETLSPEVKQAIQEKKPIEGMDRDQVRMALGNPLHKSRETNAEGVEIEDWIYGEPPGKVTFVTFQGPKVIRIKETYAGLGGTIADSPRVP